MELFHGPTFAFKDYALGAPNVLASCIKGDFDDCQSIAKQLCQSPQAKEFGCAAVNSINIVRVLLQAAYYIFASYRVAQQGQGPVIFEVPSGKAQAFETMRAIKNRFNKTICPHSATGFFAAGALLTDLDGPIVGVETAHPAKFPNALKEAFDPQPETPENLRELEGKPETFVTAEASVSAVQAAIRAAFSL